MKLPVLFVCLWACASSLALADIQIGYDDMVKLYGKSDEQRAADTWNWRGGVGKKKYTFHSDDIVITVTATDQAISTIELDRQNAFSDLEIGMILKPLSQDEDWVQKGKDWLLKDAKTKAHWNGEGRITIQ